MCERENVYICVCVCLCNLFHHSILYQRYNGYAVAVATNPVGPFRMVNEQVNVTRLKGGAGDFTLFVDYNATRGQYVGYVIYSAAFYMSIEELTPDFYYSTGRTAACTPEGSPLFSEYFVEAPAYFKRNSTYYILFGHCCCFCYQGSGIIVHTASHPLGPWTAQPGGDIACNSQSTASLSSPQSQQAHQLPNEKVSSSLRALPTPGQGCLYENTTFVSSTRSQQNFVITVPTSTGQEYIWTGDRWQQAPDGVKGHDPQYWVPLNFKDGMIERVQWLDKFTIDVL